MDKKVMAADTKRRERWMGLWANGAASQVRVKESYLGLLEHYREPHRAYHTIEHIDFCLSEFDGVRQLAKHPRAVELALWYHDVIYNVYRDDNEDKSIDYANGDLHYLAEPLMHRSRIAAYIAATKHLSYIPVWDDEMLVADIDLAGFGQTRDVATANAMLVRKEYIHVPHNDFVNGHGAILQKFLDREHLYYLPAFRDRYEKRARANITYLLKHLPKIIRVT